MRISTGGASWRRVTLRRFYGRHVGLSCQVIRTSRHLSTSPHVADLPLPPFPSSHLLLGTSELSFAIYAEFFLPRYQLLTRGVLQHINDSRRCKRQRFRVRAHRGEFRAINFPFIRETYGNSLGACESWSDF